MVMYHGNGDTLTPHIGICLADDIDIARDYAIYGGHRSEPRVHTVEIDLTGLRVVEVDGFDRDENVAPGDGDDAFDADVIVFEDETIRGTRHTTWRLMSVSALAAVRPVATIDAEEI